jgi:transcriptional regulator with XRE-family HTH domain
MYMAKLVKPRFKRKQTYRITFIRKWRTHRGLTLAQVADRVGTTHATLSRIERGVQPYNQPLLEAIADALQTEAASLLMRDPTDPEALWTILDRASPSERKQIRAIAETFLKKTGT